MPTLVCVPIMVQDPASALAEAQRAKDAGADLVELRIDEFFSGDDDNQITSSIIRLVADLPLPCIVTCRTTAEGGSYDGDDMSRVALYERLGTAHGKGEHPPKYVDIELASYTRSANIRQKVDLAAGIPHLGRDGGASLILSVHDMATRPPDLMRRFAAMNAQPAASVLKVAYRARSLRDSLELLDLPAQAQRPMISLGIGEFGLLSRVLAPKFGGFLTFAALRPAATTAPGQPTVRDLLDLYRFRSITHRTGVYGVVGWPLGHSLSPLVHNAGFEAVEHDGVYVPLPIAAGADAEATYLSLKATLLELVNHQRLDLCGCSVTAPHKEGVVRLARESGWTIDAATAGIGAANTLLISRNPDGTPANVSLFNTDAPAVTQCLLAMLGSLDGNRIGVVGAGGVARAAAYGVAHQGATVVMYARDAEKAERAAADIRGSLPRAKVVSAPLDLLPRTCCDALINCTPVGMSGGRFPDDTAFDVTELSGCDRAMIVMDTVYRPLETPLLRAAKAAGFATIDGADLFVRQATAQFTLWTSKPAPAGLFERLVRDELKLHTDQR